MKPRKTNVGFSLTELLVVVAVILILLAIIIVGVNQVYSYALQVKCQHHLEQIGQACSMYSSRFRGFLPTSWDFYTSRPWFDTLATARCIDNLAVTACPCADLVSSQAGALERPQLPAESQDALLKALRWLKANQSEDGSWPPGTGTYMQVHCDGISGLAMLCFVNYGCTTESPAEFSDTVTRGLRFLVGIQGTRNSYYASQYPGRGWFGNPDMYETGIGTNVMAQAYSLMGDRRFSRSGNDRTLGQAAQDGLDFLCGMQSPSTGCWGYGGPGPDTSVTGWVFQGLAAGKNAAFSVPGSSGALTEMWLVKSICVNRFACVSGLWKCATCGWIGTIANPTSATVCPAGCGATLSSGWLRQCTWSTDASSAPADGKCANCHGAAQNVPNDYRVPYWMNTYGGPHGLRGTLADDRRLTAMSFAVRMLMGHAVGSAAALGSPGRNAYEQFMWLKTQGQYLTAGEACTDLYFIYYMTMALSHLGGSAWTEWEDAISDALIDEQNPDGSWSASKAIFGSADCLTYPTALACISLEANLVEYLHGPKSFGYGVHSYGYNPQLGLTRRSPAGDTIMVIDYLFLEIDRQDPAKSIAPRHGGKANALFADGSVRSLVPNEIPAGMWTPQPGD